MWQQANGRVPLSRMREAARCARVRDYARGGEAVSLLILWLLASVIIGPILGRCIAWGER